MSRPCKVCGRPGCKEPVHRRRPEERAEARQVRAVEDELAGYVKRSCRDWLAIDRLAGSVGSSFGPQRGGGHADPTAAAAMAGDAAARWLDDWRKLRVQMRLLDGARAKLASFASTASAETDGPELCADPECGAELEDGNAKRLGEARYCVSRAGRSCFWRAWRRATESRQAG